MTSAITASEKLRRSRSPMLVQRLHGLEEQWLEVATDLEVGHWRASNTAPREVSKWE